MRIAKSLSARWCVAALLPLLTSCAVDTGEALQVLTEYQDGVATFYNEADGTGNCSFDPSPNDLDVAAIIKSEYLGSAVCGACLEVEGPTSSIRVRVVDSCPDCETAGHLDLSPSAFAKLADPVVGRLKVRWRMVSCDVQGPVRYRFKEGSSQWWTAIQVLNHRLPVAKLEWKKNGTWLAVKREDYNYFVEPSGMGTGPLQLRITASNGQVLEDTLPTVEAGQTFVGAAQFTGN